MMDLSIANETYPTVDEKKRGWNSWDTRSDNNEEKEERSAAWEAAVFQGAKIGVLHVNGWNIITSWGYLGRFASADLRLCLFQESRPRNSTQWC